MIEMGKIAKLLAWGMFVVVVLTTAMAVVGGEEAQAQPMPACADKIASPSDGRCAAFTRYERQFQRWSNDRYARAYYNAATNGESGLRKRAANVLCHGVLAEDFSCVPHSFYADTDLRPVKAAIGH